MSRRTIVSVSFPWFVHLNPFLSVNLLKQSRPDLFWGSTWRPPLAVVNFLLGFLQFWPIWHFRSIVLLLPAPEVGSWSTAPPNSPSFSYLIFQRSVGSCAAGQFCFSVFIHPPPPTFNLPSFCFFPPPLLLLFLSLSLVQDQGLTAPVSGDRGRDHLVRGTSLLILPNSGRL